MEPPDFVEAFVQPLEGLAMEYVVTGGVAAVVYGDPRFTRDIDIVLRLDAVDAPRFAAAFDSKRFYVPPLDALRREARRAGHFNVIDRETGLRADVYVAGSDPLHHWAFERRRILELAGGRMSVAPPEYVILRKLQYHRDSGSERHLRDVAMILRVSGDQLDMPDVAAWVERLGLGAEWARAQAYDPS